MLAGRAALTGTRAEGVPAASTTARARRWALLHAYGLGVAGVSGALTAFLLLQAIRWPPHEDETLVYFVSRQPLGELFSTVFEERGGAPLHFLLAHFVSSGWPSLTGLRLISVVFAVASVPVIAALVARLTDRWIALIATAIVAASWMVVYHGIYARMYSLFLFTSALSFLLLLCALERRSRLYWLAWAGATLAAIATQPYGAFVLAIGLVFVVARRRWTTTPLRPALISFAAVFLLALPLWLVYRVLADRFDVGLTGSSGSKLGSPVDVLSYLMEVAGDFTAGWTPTVVVVLLIALIGIVALARTRPDAAALAGAVVLVPTAAFLVTRSAGSVSLESRHLIFALPFLAMAVAAGLMTMGGLARRWGPAVVVVGLALLLVCEVAWGWHRTPWMYGGEPELRKVARERAADWLAATSRPDDVLFGYEPLYLDALEDGAPFGKLIVQRADPTLALDTLGEAAKPLGRGVWVFDATDQLDTSKQRFTVSDVSPGPQFEARAFGPFLVVRTKKRTLTAETFLRDTAVVEYQGKLIGIGDAGLNYQTAVTALSRLVEGVAAS
jgi:4-amino-4-deoxy-L-arabinose transferase-like glycosyltransferase